MYVPQKQHKHTLQYYCYFTSKKLDTRKLTKTKLKGNYLQSSKVDPGDESASRLRSSSLSRVTCRSWNNIVSSFSLICLVSDTGGGDDALPVVPDQETMNWQSENSSKEQSHFIEIISTIKKKKHLYFLLQILVQKQIVQVFISELTQKLNSVRLHISKTALFVLLVMFSWVSPLLPHVLTNYHLRRDNWWAK